MTGGPTVITGAPAVTSGAGLSLGAGRTHVAGNTTVGATTTAAGTTSLVTTGGAVGSMRLLRSSGSFSVAANGASASAIPSPASWAGLQGRV